MVKSQHAPFDGSKKGEPTSRQLAPTSRQLAPTVANLCQLFSFPDSSLRSPQRPSSALCGFLIRPQKAVHCILCTVYCLPLLPASVGASPPPLPRGACATDHGVEDPGRSTNTKGTWPHDLAKTVCVCGCVCVCACVCVYKILNDIKHYRDHIKPQKNNIQPYKHHVKPYTNQKTLYKYKNI